MKEKIQKHDAFVLAMQDVKNLAPPRKQVPSVKKGDTA